MNKTAIYAIMLAALVPLGSYFIVKRYSESAIQMPRHYLADTVITSTRDGKEYSDTNWHKLPPFSLTNQLGKQVSWDDMKGKVVIADFFFTHCPTICPSLTRNMQRLQESITNSQRVGDKTPNFLHFISFSIDPERDSVDRLKQWANRFQINPDQWWLLTGDKKDIYNMSIEEMKVTAVDGQGIDTNFIHTPYFVLVDTNRHVRGYYNGLDTLELGRLSNDIILLTMEKDPGRRSIFAGQLQVIAVAFIAAIVGVGGLLYFIRNKKKKNVDARLEKE